MAKDRKKVLHIHSSVMDKQPTPATLEVGEIAVNNGVEEITKEDRSFLSIKNANDKVVRFSTDEQMIDWIERKEVIPFQGQVRGEDGPASTKDSGDYGSYGITNDDLLNNKSNIVIKLNQVAASKTPKSEIVNGGKDIYGKLVNGENDSSREGAGIAIDMSRYAMRGGNPSFSSLTVTDKTDLSGNTTISNGDGTGTRTGHTLTINTTDVISNNTNWTETITNHTSKVITENESATTRTTVVGTADTTVTSAKTVIGTSNVSATTATLSGNTLNVKEANGLTYSGGTLNSTTTGNTTIQATDGTAGDINIYAGDALTESGKTVTINGSSSITETSPATTIVGSTTLNLSGATTTVSGTTTSVTGRNTLNLNGNTINETGNTVNISGSTALNLSGATITESGNTVNITGATSATVKGATTTVSGTTTNVYGNTNLNLTGATVTESGTTLNQKFTTINVTGATNITGATAISGNATINGNETVNGVLTVTGNTNISGDTTINKTLTVKSGVTVNSGGANITGNTTITGNETVNGNLTVTGNTYISGNTTISGDTTISGKTTFYGEVEFDQPITFTPDCNTLTAETINRAVCEAFERSVVTIEKNANPTDARLATVYTVKQNGQTVNTIEVAKDKVLKSAETVKVNNEWYIRLTWITFDPDTQTEVETTTDVSVASLVKDIDDKNPNGLTKETTYNNVVVDVWYENGQNWVSANTTSNIHASGNLSADGNLTISGDTVLGGKLNVSGNTTLKNVTAETINVTSLSATSGNITNLSASTISANTIVTPSGLSKALKWQLGNPTADTTGYNGSAEKTITIPSSLANLTNWQDGCLVVSGCVKASRGFYQSSDRNLKENIESPNPDKLISATRTPIVKFNFKSDETHTDVYGVIAQEVEANGLQELVQTDASGNKAVDYTSLMILKIAYLENENTRLMNELNNLAKRVKDLENKA